MLSTRGDIMAYGTIEILASIIIAIAVIKILVLSVSPKTWLNFANKLYGKPRITSLMAVVLAAIVLYFLQGAGITILEIFAVMLLVSLLMVMSIARYARMLIGFYSKKNPPEIWKEHWLDTLIWVVLLAWGIKELLF